MHKIIPDSSCLQAAQAAAAVQAAQVAVSSSLGAPYKLPPDVELSKPPVVRALAGGLPGGAPPPPDHKLAAAAAAAAAMQDKLQHNGLVTLSR